MNQLTNKEIAKEDAVVPFYGAAYSHIYSLNTAIKSGFSFGWMELKAVNKEVEKSE